MFYGYGNFSHRFERVVQPGRRVFREASAFRSLSLPTASEKGEERRGRGSSISPGLLKGGCGLAFLWEPNAALG